MEINKLALKRYSYRESPDSSNDLLIRATNKSKQTDVVVKPQPTPRPQIPHVSRRFLDTKGKHGGQLYMWFLGLTPEERGRVLSFEDKDGIILLKEMYAKQANQGDGLFFGVEDPLLVKVQEKQKGVKFDGNFCFKKLSSLETLCTYPERFLLNDKKLEESTRLCDTREYLDTMTVASDLLEDGLHFLQLMEIVTRGNFLSKECKVAWDGTSRTWRWEKPSWFEDMGFHSLGAFIASKLETVLWMRYFDAHKLDPRSKPGALNYSFPTYLEGLLSKSYLIKFWKECSVQERRKIVGPIGNLIEHVLLETDDEDRSKKLKQADYPKLLSALVDLSVEEKNLELLFSDSELAQNEKAFIEILYFSPLHRAGIPIDIILRRVGMSVQSAYTEKLSMDLIIGEEAEKMKKNADAESKKKKKKKKKAKRKEKETKEKESKERELKEIKEKEMKEKAEKERNERERRERERKEAEKKKREMEIRKMIASIVSDVIDEVEQIIDTRPVAIDPTVTIYPTVASTSTSSPPMGASPPSVSPASGSPPSPQPIRKKNKGKKKKKKQPSPSAPVNIPFAIALADQDIAGPPQSQKWRQVAPKRKEISPSKSPTTGRRAKKECASEISSESLPMDRINPKPNSQNSQQISQMGPRVQLTVLNRLHQEIMLHFDQLRNQIHRSYRPQAEVLIVRIRTIVQSIWPTAVVEAYGSYVTNLCLPSSDLDLVVIGAKLPHHGSCIQLLASILRQYSWFGSIQAIDTAKVPVIKLNSRSDRSDGSSHGIPVDISFEDENSSDSPAFYTPNGVLVKHGGLSTCEVVKGFLRKMPALAPLVVILKQLLHERGMNNAYTGGLSSYCVVLMCVNFLQLHGGPLELQSNNLGLLLLNFLFFFGKNFNYQTTGIAVTNGGFHFDLNVSYYKYPPAPMVVVDPLNPSNNIGYNTFAIPQIQAAFEDAHSRITSPFHMHFTPANILGRIINLEESNSENGKSQSRKDEIQKTKTKRMDNLLVQ